MTHLDRALAEARPRADAAITAYLLSYRTHLCLRLGRLAEAEADGRGACALHDARRGRRLVPVRPARRARRAGSRRRGLGALSPAGAHRVPAALGDARARRSSPGDRGRADRGGPAELLSARASNSTRWASGIPSSRRGGRWPRSSPTGLATGSSRFGSSAELSELAQRTGAPTALAQALRVHGRLHGDVAALSRAAQTAARTPDLPRVRRSLTELGAAQIQHGEREQARETLRSALATAHEAGALTLAERARAELIAAGGRPRRAALRGVGALTPAELQVARLAGRGAEQSRHRGWSVRLPQDSRAAPRPHLRQARDLRAGRAREGAGAPAPLRTAPTVVRVEQPKERGRRPERPGSQTRRARQILLRVARSATRHRRSAGQTGTGSKGGAPTIVTTARHVRAAREEVVMVLITGSRRMWAAQHGRLTDHLRGPVLHRHPARQNTAQQLEKSGSAAEPAGHPSGQAAAQNAGASASGARKTASKASKQGQAVLNQAREAHRMRRRGRDRHRQAERPARPSSAASRARTINEREDDLTWVSSARSASCPARPRKRAARARAARPGDHHRRQADGRQHRGRLRSQPRLRVHRRGVARQHARATRPRCRQAIRATILPQLLTGGATVAVRVNPDDHSRSPSTSPPSRRSITVSARGR